MQFFFQLQMQQEAMTRLTGVVAITEEVLRKWPVPFETDESIVDFFISTGSHDRIAALTVYLAKVDWHATKYARRTLEMLLTQDYLKTHMIYSDQ